MVDQAQVIANLDRELDMCRQYLASDTHDLRLVYRLLERMDKLLDQRSALTHARH